MRERLLPKSSTLRTVRITPAYAGKTCLYLTPNTLEPDHPRVCGKDWVPSKDGCIVSGSPPRMRERQEIERERAEGDRITPAYAGKTFPLRG